MASDLQDISGALGVQLSTAQEVHAAPERSSPFPLMAWALRGRGGVRTHDMIQSHSDTYTSRVW